MVRIAAFMLPAVLMAATAHAQTAIPSFVATCKDTQTHAFRADSDPQGRPLPEQWGDGEKFLSEPFERFTYVRGANVIGLRDGRTAPVIASTSTVLLVADVHASDIATSAWTFLIHFKLKRVVGTQVNGHDMLGSGVKSRHVRLSCDFEERRP